MRVRHSATTPMLITRKDAPRSLYTRSRADQESSISSDFRSSQCCPRCAQYHSATLACSSALVLRTWSRAATVVTTATPSAAATPIQVHTFKAPARDPLEIIAPETAPPLLDRCRSTRSLASDLELLQDRRDGDDVPLELQLRLLLACGHADQLGEVENR